MRKFGLDAKRMPTLELRDSAGHVAKLEPHALWIIEENGPGRSHARRTLLLPHGYRREFAEPNWEVSRAERRCDREAVTREWLRRILQ